jgi:hypothetical protein
MSPIIVLVPLAFIELAAVVLYMRRGLLTQEKRVQLIVIVLSLIVLNVVIGIATSVLFPRLLHA